MAKAKKCTLIMNSPLNGYIFSPIKCKSIAEALTKAAETAMPYRLFDKKGSLIRAGWIM